jgi:hypothetical protein
MPVTLKNGRILSDLEVQQLNNANQNIVSGKPGQDDAKNVDFAKSQGWTPTVVEQKPADTTFFPGEKTQEQLQAEADAAQQKAGDEALNKGALEAPNPELNKPVTTPVQNFVKMKSPDGTYATVDKNDPEYDRLVAQGYTMTTEVSNAEDQMAADNQKKLAENTAKEVATAKTTEKPKEQTPAEVAAAALVNGGAKDVAGAGVAGVAEIVKDTTKELEYANTYKSQNGSLPTQAQINQAVYGSQTPKFAKTIVDSAIINKVDQSGFDSLSGTEVDALAKSMATGGVSLADSITLMSAQTKVPESVRQAFFDSLGLTKLEQEAFNAPGEDMQTLYDSKYKELDLKSKQNDIAKAKEDMKNELVEAGENPFLDATKRQGRAQMITDRYQNKIDRLTTEYNNGIDQVNQYITNHLATQQNAQAKLTYMQSKAEKMLSGYEVDLQNEVLKRFLPSYMKESATASSISAEKTLKDKLTIDKGYSEVTGWDQNDINNAINKGVKVVKVGNSVYIDQSDYLKSQEGKYEITYDPLTGARMIFNTKTGGFGVGGDNNNGTVDIAGTSNAGIPGGATGKTVTVNGVTFDIGTYATDPKHEAGVSSILSKIGKMETVDDINKYIKSVSPESPVTGEMIAKASEENNIPWEIQMAMMQQDSNFADPRMNDQGKISPVGARQRAYRTFNPGNVGNVDSGANVNRKDWQSGVNALAQNLAKRIVGPTAPKTEIGGSKATPQVQQIAQEVVEGSRSMDTLKTYPDAIQNAINTEIVRLNKEKAGQETETNPDLLLIKNSAGKKSLSVGGLSIQTGIEKTMQTFNQFEDLSNYMDKIKTGPISGLINQNPYSKTGAEVKAMITGLIPGLARGTYGEVGVLTDADIENYKKTVPNLSTPESAKNFVLAMTSKMLTNSLKNKLTTAAKSGWDVSQFTTDLQSLEERSQNMLIQQQLKQEQKITEKANKKNKSVFEQMTGKSQEKGQKKNTIDLGSLDFKF